MTQVSRGEPYVAAVSVVAIASAVHIVLLREGVDADLAQAYSLIVLGAGAAFAAGFLLSRWLNRPRYQKGTGKIITVSVDIPDVGLPHLHQIVAEMRARSGMTTAHWPESSDHVRVSDRDAHYAVD